MVVARQRVTPDQFLGLPKEEPALECEDGATTRKVSPRGKHSARQLELAGSIKAAAGASSAIPYTQISTRWKRRYRQRPSRPSC